MDHFPILNGQKIVFLAKIFKFHIIKLKSEINRRTIPICQKRLTIIFDFGQSEIKTENFRKKFLQEKILFISSDFVSYGDIKEMLQSQSPWGSLKGATRWLHQKISSAKISSAKNYPRSYLFYFYYKTFLWGSWFFAREA